MGQKHCRGQKTAQLPSMVDTSGKYAFPSWAGLRKLPRGVPRKGGPALSPPSPAGQER